MTKEKEENKVEEVKEEIIEDIEEDGVPKEIAEKEEEIAEEMKEKSESEKHKEAEEADSPEKVSEEMFEEEVERELEEKETKKADKEEKEIVSGWKPKTTLGKQVKEGKIKKIDEILDNKKKILEEQIVDSLINVNSELIHIGQSKGKFGGGKRRAWRQTQRKTKEGNIPSFSTMAVVGDENGHIGIGTGKAKETLPARDKAIRKAKLNIIKVKRTCSAFDCACSEEHTVPFKVEGKSGSVKVVLVPAPQGTGLVAANELKKLLKLAGIKDVYSKTFGKKRTTFNLVQAGMNALKKTNKETEK